LDFGLRLDVFRTQGGIRLVYAEYFGMPWALSGGSCLRAEYNRRPDPRAPLSICEPGERFARPLDRSFKGVRVAWFKDLGGVPFDPRVRAVVDGHRATFESLGCIVEQAEPDFAPAEIAFRMLRAWNSAIRMPRACASIPTISKTRSKTRPRKDSGSPAWTSLLPKRRTR
jgi:Asp-tRNA(Asn)/Glu-tRNA(Gln) amidotransferase A subunit family amidase